MTSQKSSQDTEREQVVMFLRRNFPQIRMHGGDSSILELDKSDGYVHIQLSGACSGCGISPMTTEAIKRRMNEDIEWVSKVSVSTGSLESDVPDINPDVVPDSSNDSDKSEEESDEPSGVNAPF